MTGEFVRVWRYRVDAARRVEFERRYGAQGDWVQLFARAEGFLGTQLLRDPGDPGVYLTLDRWRRATDFEAFFTRFGTEYAALDHACEGLNREESDLGEYEDTGPG